MTPRERSAATSEADPPPELLRFLARFDRGEYWLAHEELEELWLREKLDAYKGLIQVAAALLHAERGNWRGALSKAENALGYLEEAPARLRGIDVGALRRRLGELVERLEALAGGEAQREEAEDLRFRLAPLFEGEVDLDAVEDVELPYRVRRYERGYRPYGRSSPEEREEES